MKGDGFIKIKINIRGIYKYDINQPYVEIYDMNGCIISSGFAKCGCYLVCLYKCSCYKVKVKYLNKIVNKVIYINKNNYDIFFNIKVSSGNIARTITVRLNDYYYNLPISKGVLNFG